MPGIWWEHAAEARAALKAIVADPGHGVAALSSAQAMSNLLKDLLPDAPREKSILVAAAEAGLADTLREHVAQGMDPSTAISLTASSFSNLTPFTPEACTWVAGEIAIALGISRGVADAPPGGQARPGQVGQQGMPSQINPIPVFGAKTQADTPQAQAQGYPIQVAPQAFPPGPGQVQGGGYGAGPRGQAMVGGYGPGGQIGGYVPGSQIGGYVPGGPPVGFGPGGPGGRTPGRSGAKRGLLTGSGILVVIIVITVLTTALSSKGTPSANSSHSSTPPSPTTSPTTSLSPTTGVESLRTIMNPVSFAPIGTDCKQAPLKGLNEATVTGQLVCLHTSVNGVPTNHIVVWAYQFDSYNDYLAGFSKINSITGFKPGSASGNCPPTATKYGSMEWDSTSNPKYGKSKEPGQRLECFIQYTKSHKYQPLLIWTAASQYVVFLARNEARGGKFAQLDKWWDQVSYG